MNLTRDSTSRKKLLQGQAPRAFSSAVSVEISLLGRVRDFALSVWNATWVPMKQLPRRAMQRQLVPAGLPRDAPVFGRGTGTSELIPA